VVGLTVGPGYSFAADLPASGEATAHQVALPHLLSDADATRYREIFKLQADEQWQEADRQAAQLRDRLLMGTVEAQRYLGLSYPATYDQLRDWLRANADAPDAPMIYALAMKERPRDETAPTKPLIGDSPVVADGPHHPLGAGDEGPSIHHKSTTEWRAALASWRGGRFTRAKEEFEAIAQSGNRSPWTISGAAFWAARAELRCDHPELFNYWLGVAAQHPRTFYGLLARRTLGLDPYVDVDPEGFGELDAQILTGVDGGRRALALIEVGEPRRAEAELRALALRASTNLLQSILALTDRANMDDLSVEIAAQIGTDDEENEDGAQYPMPHWKPRGGFQVDRALLYGVMRQESKFRPVAHSHSGASGLMQLMPATARTMSQHTGIHGQLADPAVNLALAQQYILELMNDGRVNGNLLYFAVAYNRGPGTLPRAKAVEGTRDDPLLFVESINNRETRIFLHQVLTNYWIYRLRLRQPTPDLDALAAGEWPIYTALDDSAGLTVRHAQN
jgi:soluble lytic murein transglycosylase-like protein